MEQLRTCHICGGQESKWSWHRYPKGVTPEGGVEGMEYWLCDSCYAKTRKAYVSQLGKVEEKSGKRGERSPGAKGGSPEATKKMKAEG